MKSMYAKIVVSILIVGLLAACGAPTTEAPAFTPAPTEEVAPATEAPTEAATEAPATEAPTEAPATEPAAATQPVVEGATVSFSTDILPIFESRCIGCHGGERTQEGLDLKTHASLIAGSNNGLVVTPGDAANSLLVELVATQKMPKRGPKLTPPQVQLINDWVNQGAQDN
jgi:mono/diheme cytochrome c family protein